MGVFAHPVVYRSVQGYEVQVAEVDELVDPPCTACTVSVLQGLSVSCTFDVVWLGELTGNSATFVK
jgi:hypothetical protein